jgi:hypothetical protein
VQDKQNRHIHLKKKKIWIIISIVSAFSSEKVCLDVVWEPLLKERNQSLHAEKKEEEMERNQVGVE